MRGILENPVAELSGYELRHLAAHLVEAGRPDDLHRLLALETASGRNAWFEAKETGGDAFGIAADFRTALACAEGELIRDGVRRSLGLVGRYALMTSVLGSYAGSLPPELLSALVAEGIWSWPRALASARQVPGSQRRAVALARLAPHLPEEQRLGVFREAVGAVREVRRDVRDLYWEDRPPEDDRVEVLEELAPLLPQSLAPEALPVVGEIDSEHERAAALRLLIPYLPDRALPDALALALRIEYWQSRATALVALAPRLTDPALSASLLEASRIARRKDIGPDWFDSRLEIAPHLPPPERDEEVRAVLAELQTRPSDGWRLEGLALHLLPSRLTEALSTACNFKEAHERARALASLAPFLPPTAGPRVLQEVRELERVTIPFAVAEASRRACPGGMTTPHRRDKPGGSQTQSQTALEDEEDQATVLLAVLRHLAPADEASVFRAALAAAEGIIAPRSRSKAFAELASLAPGGSGDDLSRRAVEALRSVKPGAQRAGGLEDVLPHLAPASLWDALYLALAIEEEKWRASALLHLAPRLSAEQARVAREAVRGLSDAEDRSAVLTALALRVEPPERPPVLQEALAVVRTIDDGRQRANLRVQLAAGMGSGDGERLLSRALREAEHAGDHAGLAAILLDLMDSVEVGVRPRLIAAAWAAIREIDQRGLKVGMLAGLVQYAPPEERPRVLESALAAVEESDDPESVLADLAPHLTRPTLAAAVRSAERIPHPLARVRALTWLLRGVTEELRPTVLRRALRAIRQIPKRNDRVLARADLAPSLTGPQRDRLLKAVLRRAPARKTGDAESQGEALVRLLPSLTGSQQEEPARSVLAAARQSLYGLGSLLRGAAPYLYPGCRSPLPGRVKGDAGRGVPALEQAGDGLGVLAVAPGRAAVDGSQGPGVAEDEGDLVIPRRAAGGRLTGRAGLRSMRARRATGPGLAGLLPPGRPADQRQARPEGGSVLWRRAARRRPPGGGRHAAARPQPLPGEARGPARGGAGVHGGAHRPGAPADGRAGAEPGPGGVVLAERLTGEPFTLFRIFNYPPPADPALWGVGEHTDYGLLTILGQDDAGGLEVKSRSGWVPAPPVEGSFVCNLGDMLDRMTGGLYRCVRNPAPRDRLSFPFFFDPSFSARVRPIDLPGRDLVPDDRAERCSWPAGGPPPGCSGTAGPHRRTWPRSPTPPGRLP
jgi:hypothetical protein